MATCWIEHSAVSVQRKASDFQQGLGGDSYRPILWKYTEIISSSLTKTLSSLQTYDSIAENLKLNHSKSAFLSTLGRISQIYVPLIQEIVSTAHYQTRKSQHTLQTLICDIWTRQSLNLLYIRHLFLFFHMKVPSIRLPNQTHHQHLEELYASQTIMILLFQFQLARPLYRAAGISYPDILWFWWEKDFYHFFFNALGPFTKWLLFLVSDLSGKPHYPAPIGVSQSKVYYLTEEKKKGLIISVIMLPECFWINNIFIEYLWNNFILKKKGEALSVSILFFPQNTTAYTIEITVSRPHPLISTAIKCYSSRAVFPATKIAFKKWQLREL